MNQTLIPCQTAGNVVLVLPTAFRYDPETAASNGFQQLLPNREVTLEARAEFNRLVEAITLRGIGVTVLEPYDSTAPNAVFPNNWFSTHDDGRIVLYPMATASRRSERNLDVGATLRMEGFEVEETLNLTPWEAESRILEGTGSLVLDRAFRKAFAAYSPRTSKEALEEWCRRMEYEPVGFLATVDGTTAGMPVYHTNVLMGIGEGFAVVTLEAIPAPAERNTVREQLEAGSKEVIALSLLQMHGFAGNMIELRGAQGPCIFMSQSAFDVLEPGHRRALSKHGELIAVDIPTIQAVGGGSVRCMIAENFLPSRAKG